MYSIPRQIGQDTRKEWPHVALETLAVRAGRTGVQPSSIVRFAKHFGFDGATQMARNLLIAVSDHPYAKETVHVVDAAVERSCKVLSISDSLVSPAAKSATRVLQVREAEIRQLRSLSASMYLVQVRVSSCAFATSPAPAAHRKAAAPSRKARK